MGRKERPSDGSTLGMGAGLQEDFQENQTEILTRLSVFDCGQESMGKSFSVPQKNCERVGNRYIESQDNGK